MYIHVEIQPCRAFCIAGAEPCVAGSLATGAAGGYMLATVPFRKLFQRACMRRELSVAVDCNHLLGEGPIWDSDNSRLIYVDKVPFGLLDTCLTCTTLTLLASGARQDLLV